MPGGERGDYEERTILYGTEYRKIYFKKMLHKTAFKSSLFLINVIRKKLNDYSLPVDTNT